MTALASRDAPLAEHIKAHNASRGFAIVREFNSLQFARIEPLLNRLHIFRYGRLWHRTTLRARRVRTRSWDVAPAGREPLAQAAYTTARNKFDNDK